MSEEKNSIFEVKCRYVSACTTINFSGRKIHLYDDKLLKNGINIKGEDDGVVMLSANGPGRFQGTKYVRNINLNGKEKGGCIIPSLSNVFNFPKFRQKSLKTT